MAQKMCQRNRGDSETFPPPDLKGDIRFRRGEKAGNGSSQFWKSLPRVYIISTLAPITHTATEIAMSITLLGAAFLAIVLAVAVIGGKTILRGRISAEDANREKCSICRTPYPKGTLVERQIGDHRVLYFCPNCISSLHNELVSKN